MSEPSKQRLEKFRRQAVKLSANRGMWQRDTLELEIAEIAQRAGMLARAQGKREAQLERQLAETRETLFQVVQFMQRARLEATPPVSFLDDMMASLEAKPDAVSPTPPDKLSLSFVEALLAGE